MRGKVTAKDKFMVTSLGEPGINMIKGGALTFIYACRR